MNNKNISRVCLLNPQGYVSHPAPLGKTDTGGQIVYILEVAKALGKKGIKVDIITRKFDGFLEEEKLFDNVKIIRIPCGNGKFVVKEKLYELMPEFVENFMLYIEKKRLSYDIIHSHYWDGGYAGLLLAKMLDIPHIHTPHTLGKSKKIEMDVEDLPVTKIKPAYRYHVRIAIEQKIFNKANAVLVLCETSRIQLLQYYMVDFEKIHVIFPGVNTNYFNTKPTALDKEIDLKENSILTMCRFVPAKGLDRVIDALSLIKGKIKFNLYMGGSNGENITNLSEEEKVAHQKITGIIDSYGLESHTNYLGFVNHDGTLPAYYRKADIFILPSRYEPFGLTTLEAMACGTVPLVSQTAGSKEIIVDGLNGFVVDTHDRKNLADKIKMLLKDPKLRKKISENAAFTVREHYSWDKISEKIINLYKSLL